jgi:START domain
MASFTAAGSIKPVTATQYTFADDDHAAFLLQKAETALETLLINTKNSALNSDGKPWVQCLNRPELHLQVFSSEASGTPLKRFKAVCIFHDVSPEQVIHFIADENRVSWDKNLKEFTPVLVRDFSDSTSGKRKQLRIIRSATKPAGPISGRDFVDVTITATLDDGSIAIGGSSLEPNEAGGRFLPNKLFVRGFNLVGSGSHLERCGPDGKDTKISYVIHTNLKGWFLPIIINNALGSSYVAYFEDLRRAVAAAYPTSVAKAKADVQLSLLPTQKRQYMPSFNLYMFTKLSNEATGIM